MRHAFHAAPLAAAATAAVLLISPTAAQAEDGRFSVGAIAGTLGLGLEAGFRFDEHVGLRANAATYDDSRTEEVDDIEYDGELNLESYGLALDWYPFGGRFRVSAGACANGNEIGLEAAPTTNVTVGDITFTPAQIGRLTGTVESDEVAPTLTLGWGGTLAPGFAVTFDVGVMFQGSPTIENLTSTGGLASNQPLLLEQLRIEEARVEEDMEDLDLWPILQLTFSWRF